MILLLMVATRIVMRAMSVERLTSQMILTK